MSQTREATESGADEQTHISAHCCTPERTVFTEDGNVDGWIATDLTVPLEQ